MIATFTVETETKDTKQKAGKGMKSGSKNEIQKSKKDIKEANED